MEEKILNWFKNSDFYQGQYAENKIQEIELMNIRNIEDLETIKS